MPLYVSAGRMRATLQSGDAGGNEESVAMETHLQVRRAIEVCAETTQRFRRLCGFSVIWLETMLPREHERSSRSLEPHVRKGPGSELPADSPACQGTGFLLER